MPYFNRFEDYDFSKYRAQIYSSYSNRRHTAKYYHELMEIPELNTQLIGLFYKSLVKSRLKGQATGNWYSYLLLSC